VLHLGVRGLRLLIVFGGSLTTNAFAASSFWGTTGGKTHAIMLHCHNERPTKITVDVALSRSQRQGLEPKWLRIGICLVAEVGVSNINWSGQLDETDSPNANQPVNVVRSNNICDFEEWDSGACLGRCRGHLKYTDQRTSPPPAP
jgi:hypothetical protein